MTHLPENVGFLDDDAGADLVTWEAAAAPEAGPILFTARASMRRPKSLTSALGGLDDRQGLGRGVLLEVDLRQLVERHLVVGLDVEDPLQNRLCLGPVADPDVDLSLGQKCQLS